MAKPKKPEETSAPKEWIIKPLIRVDGELHPWEEMEQVEGILPTFKAIGMVQIAPGSKQWISYVVHIVDGKVTKIEAAEPNDKIVAVDDLKIQFVTSFIDNSGFLV